MSTPTPGAPSLPALRETLRAALDAYPELRRELGHAVQGVERALRLPAVAPRRERRGHGLRDRVPETHQ